ncbi:3-ketodihydrosphingosine reductase [Anoplophora glabripennis]|uniref:3-ketodihydrosphingosine reductase n=1 Tax=Anoplophora glabripennis TaxID=217634 RepID=UPI0008759AFC|nr:3-ketodihydrosphingosine reductase [Anoplophora glabripennis]
MLIVMLVPLFIIAILVKFLKPQKKLSIEGKHVVVTGGSSGIGKSVAILAAQKGAHVTILARNIDKLSEAQQEIKKHCANEELIISKVSVDVANYEDVENNLCEVEEIVGPIYMLINCAGMAICRQVEDFTEQDIKTLIEVNFLGTLYPIKAIVPKFKQRREGIIVLTGSQVSLMGMYGYSVYASSKFALRGLAESLFMEVKPYNVSVTLALPPDTDTPGFENENKTKPEETHLLSNTGGLYNADDVARKLIDDALASRFFSYIGFESFILTTLCVGMSPFSSFLELLLQCVALGPLRLIGAFYIIYFDKIVKKCFHNKQIKKEQ